ncbi:24150_t:CDS:2, partial [Racocetra persica]
NEIKGIPPAYSKIYKECWQDNPDSRPSIQQIVLDLEVLINNNNQNVTSTSHKLETSQILKLINQIIQNQA